MAKVIVFYQPSRFKRKKTKWIPRELRGKMLRFPESHAKRAS